MSTRVFAPLLALAALVAQIGAVCAQAGPDRGPDTGTGFVVAPVRC